MWGTLNVSIHMGDNELGISVLSILHQSIHSLPTYYDYPTERSTKDDG